jgi:hypothetical protein
MLNKSTKVKSIQIDGGSLVLLIEDANPYVRYMEEQYVSLIPLFEDLPALCDPANAKECAEIVSFLLLGEHAYVIENVQLYQNDYAKNKSNSVLSRFGEYDVSLMHPPKQSNQQLIFFIHDLTEGIPYQVICPIPYTTDSKPVQCQLLPMV